MILIIMSFQCILELRSPPTTYLVLFCVIFEFINKFNIIYDWTIYILFIFQDNVPGSNRNSLKDSVGGGNSNRSSLDVSSSSYNTLIIHNQDDSWPPRPTPIRWECSFCLRSPLARCYTFKLSYKNQYMKLTPHTLLEFWFLF